MPDRSISVAELNRHGMADSLNRVHYNGERIAITRHGKPVAALVSMSDLKSMEDREDKADLVAIKRAEKVRGKNVVVVSGKHSTLR